jgi:hypothetical protein
LFSFLQAELAAFHVANESKDIPPGWRSVTMVDALKNLLQMYSINSGDGEGNKITKNQLFFK